MDTIVTAKLSNPIYSDYWSVSLVMLYHAFNTKCKKDVLVWELACTIGNGIFPGSENTVKLLFPDSLDSPTVLQIYLIFFFFTFHLWTSFFSMIKTTTLI